jgi:hypothetical protein
MLRAGELPEDEFCVVCHAATDRVAEFDVVCERVDVKRPVGGCGYAAYMILFGWIGLLLASLKNQTETREFGRHVAFCLPLRLCPVCQAARGQRDLKELLSRVPVYAYLFGKYPHAIVKVW